MGTSVFIIDRHTKIAAQKAEVSKVAQLFNYFLQKQYGFSLNVSHVAPPNAIATADNRASNEFTVDIK